MVSFAGSCGVSDRGELLCWQGVFAPKTYATYGLPGHWYGALEWQYPPHQRQGSYEEEGRAVNTLKVKRQPPHNLSSMYP